MRAATSSIFFFLKNPATTKISPLPLHAPLPIGTGNRQKGLVLDESRPPGEKFLHHGLLEGAGLLPPLLQRRQLRVHVRQHPGDGGLFVFGWRSEEHTSELQSQSNLVCRLLLETK